MIQEIRKSLGFGACVHRRKSASLILPSAAAFDSQIAKYFCFMGGGFSGST
jgi:hypothetical protein